MAEKQAPYTAALLYACRYVNVPGLETLGAVDPRLLVFLDVDLMAEKYSDEESAQVLVHLMYHVMFDHHGLSVAKLEADGDHPPDLLRIAAVSLGDVHLQEPG